MKKEKALEFLPKFPELSDKLQTKLRQQLRPFVLYNHSGKARCTHCEAEFELDKAVKHKEKDVCPVCGRKSTYIDCVYRYAGCTVESVANVMVFLAGEDNNLYIRCFAQKMFFRHGELVPIIDQMETQRYVVTPDGSARYGVDWYWTKEKGWYQKHYKTEWTVRTKISDPVFLNQYAYTSINTAALRKTFLKYSGADRMKFDDDLSLFDYIRFYAKYPGVERLAKCGLMQIVKCAVNRYSGYYRKNYYYHPSEDTGDIQWKENEVHKMLGVTRLALRYIRAGKVGYTSYKHAVVEFPNMSEERRIAYAKATDNRYTLLGNLAEWTDKPKTKILDYIIKHGIELHDYRDYLRICIEELGYDVTDRVVAFPPHFAAAHDRVISAEAAIRQEQLEKRNAELAAKFEKLKNERKSLEFQHGDYIIIQPRSAAEIIAEGKILSHCVGGYAERHMNGATTIMFLRERSAPDKPFYTIEVSNSLKLVQCRGYKNNWEESGGSPKPKEIKELEKLYQLHLDAERQKREKRKKSAIKQKESIKIGA
ncbi:MAG: PcfJ domain-containing protein [Oscillospiraceae bacterium]|nr:PcfJ domain-containing protein [Oscillospiraceae bacterium]